MGLIDSLKGKAQGLIQGNEQAIKDGIAKAGNFVDTKTGGKYSGHIDSVQNGASHLINKADGKPGGASATEQTP